MGNVRYRVRRGFRGVAVLQKLIDGPAFLGGQVDASVRVPQWVDVKYDASPVELREYDGPNVTRVEASAAQKGGAQ